MAELDPAMAAILAEINRQALPSYDTMPAAEARAEALRRNAFWNEIVVPVPRVEEVVAPGPRGEIRVRLYAGERAGPSAPCLLYIHGGGWVICSLDTHDGVCRRLATPRAFASPASTMAWRPSTRSRHGWTTALPRALAARPRRAARHRPAPDRARRRFGRRQPGARTLPHAARRRRAAAHGRRPDLRRLLRRSRHALARGLRRRRLRPVDRDDALVLGPLRARPGAAPRSAGLAPLRRPARPAAALRLGGRARPLARRQRASGRRLALPASTSTTASGAASPTPAS